MSVRGYAIKVAGEIDVRTVSPSDTGAMVNWLAVHASNGWMAVRDDGRIKEGFAAHAAKRPAGLACVKVNITEVYENLS